jgi:hypothetical protein
LLSGFPSFAAGGQKGFVEGFGAGLRGSQGSIRTPK